VEHPQQGQRSLRRPLFRYRARCLPDCDDPQPVRRSFNLDEILEERYGRRSTALTSQIPVDKWHAVIGDPTFADAIPSTMPTASIPRATACVDGARSRPSKQPIKTILFRYITLGSGTRAPQAPRRQADEQRRTTSPGARPMIHFASPSPCPTRGRTACRSPDAVTAVLVRVPRDLEQGVRAFRRELACDAHTCSATAGMRRYTLFTYRGDAWWPRQPSAAGIARATRGASSADVTRPHWRCRVLRGRDAPGYASSGSCYGSPTV
jgi:IstB-like ATP binding protein